MRPKILFLLLLLSILIPLTITAGGCKISTIPGSTKLDPFNIFPNKPKTEDPDYKNDSYKVLGLKLTYRTLARMWWVVPGGFFMVVGGIALFFYSRIKTFLYLAGTGILMVLAYFSLLRWLPEALWVALIGCLGVVFYMFLTRARALKETVFSVEKLLGQFGGEKKEELIDILRKNQSTKNTQAIIKNIKKNVPKEFKNFIPPTNGGYQPKEDVA